MRFKLWTDSIHDPRHPVQRTVNTTRELRLIVPGDAQPESLHHFIWLFFLLRKAKHLENIVFHNSELSSPGWQMLEQLLYPGNPVSQTIRNIKLPHLSATAWLVKS